MPVRAPRDRKIEALKSTLRLRMLDWLRGRCGKFLHLVDKFGQRGKYARIVFQRESPAKFRRVSRKMPQADNYLLIGILPVHSAVQRAYRGYRERW